MALSKTLDRLSVFIPFKFHRNWLLGIGGVLVLVLAFVFLRGGWWSTSSRPLLTAGASSEAEVRGVLLQSIRALNDKNYDLAIAGLNQALAKNPRQLDLMLQLGMTYRKARSFSEADRIYSQALRFYPDCIECLNNQAVNWLQAGDTRKAIELLTQVNQRKPDYSEAYFNLAIAYEKGGQIRSAVAAYQHYLQSIPVNDSHPEPAMARERVRRLQEGL